MKTAVWLIVTLALGILAAPLAANAQPPGKIPRIGVLAAGSPATFISRYEAFRQGLRELGHVEGQNIAIEYRYAEGKLERLSDLAAEELKHPQNSIAMQDRTTESAAQPFLLGHRSSWKIAISSHIGNPGGLPVAPDSAWNSNARGKGSLSTGPLKLRHLRSGGVPNGLAA